MAIIDTLFITKTADKPYPLGPHIPIYPYKGVPPPGSIVIIGLGTRTIACRDSAGPATCFSDSMPAWQLVVVRLVS